MIYSPLEQFDIIYFQTDVGFFLKWFGIALEAFTTNYTINLFVISIFLIILFELIESNYNFLPKFIQYLSKDFYKFIQNIILENMNNCKYFSYVLLLFIFICLCNLFGLIPFSFTITSHIIITFGLSFSITFGALIIALKTHRLHFFSLFFPKGAPIVMSPLIVIIELISYLSRSISLSIRLAANMMAGHILLRIVAEFISNLNKIYTIFPFIALLALFMLEVFIGVLQSYVITTLFCIYINEALTLH